MEFDAAYIAVEDMQISPEMPEGVILSQGSRHATESSKASTPHDRLR